MNHSRFVVVVGASLWHIDTVYVETPPHGTQSVETMNAYILSRWYASQLILAKIGVPPDGKNVEHVLRPGCYFYIFYFSVILSIKN